MHASLNVDMIADFPPVPKAQQGVMNSEHFNLFCNSVIFGSVNTVFNTVSHGHWQDFLGVCVYTFVRG
jgi:hypothetical protein